MVEAEGSSIMAQSRDMAEVAGPNGLYFIHVQSGEYRRGCLPSQGRRDEGPPLPCHIEVPFALTARPVTQQQWELVMGANPSKFNEGWTAGLRPVDTVSRDDIDLFLTRLNAETCMKLFHYLFVKKLDILEVNNSVLKKKVTMAEPYKL